MSRTRRDSQENLIPHQQQWQQQSSCSIILVPHVGPRAVATQSSCSANDNINTRLLFIHPDVYLIYEHHSVPARQPSLIPGVSSELILLHHSPLRRCACMYLRELEPPWKGYGMASTPQSSFRRRCYASRGPSPPSSAAGITGTRRPNRRRSVRVGYPPVEDSGGRCGRSSTFRSSPPSPRFSKASAMERAGRES